MKTLRLTGLLFFTINFCFAQTQKTDSLKQDLDDYSKKDTVRAQKIFNYSNSLSSDDPDKATIYARQGIELAKKLGWYTGSSKGLLLLAYLQTIQEKFDDAVASNLEALKISEDNHNENMVFNACSHLGETYRLMGDLSLAKIYEQKSLDIANARKNEREIFHALTGLASVYAQNNEWQYADTLLNKALNMAISQIDRYNLLTILSLKGEVALQKEDYAGAIVIYRKVLSENIKGNNYHGISFSQSQLSIAYATIKKKDSAYYFGQSALQTAKKYKLSKELNDANDALYNYYSAFGDYKKALEYRLAYDSIHDATYNLQTVQNAERSRAKLEQEKKDAVAKLDQEKKDAETKRTRNLQYSFIGTFLLLSIFFFWNSRQKQKAKNKIEKAYSELKTTQQQLIQSEKMASLGELTAGIAHEIQNPLNFVNNFSEVNTELIDEAGQEIDKGNISEVKTILNDIKENEQKINHHGKRADAIVKGMLQHSRSSTGVKEPVDINALADEYFRLAYHGLRAKDKGFSATLQTDYDPAIGNINIIPQDIGRVILNLITNAFYAVNERFKAEGLGYDPTVSISTKKMNDKVEIRVRDNGNGIPQKAVGKIFQPFFTTKPTGQGTGLGLSLSYDIIKAHGGELKAETKENEFAEFIITLPQ